MIPAHYLETLKRAARERPLMPGGKAHRIHTRYGELVCHHLGTTFPKYRLRNRYIFFLNGQRCTQDELLHGDLTA